MMKKVNFVEMGCRSAKFAVASLAFLVAGQTLASDRTGYAVDSDGELVKSGFGECVRGGGWTKELSIPECDKELAARLEKERLAAEAEARKKDDAGKAAAAFAALEVGKQPSVNLSDVGTVTFATNSAQLTSQTKTTLSDMVQNLKRYDHVEKITIGGYTDSTGPESYNQKLAEQRANSVKQFVVSQGVSESVVESRGYGEAKPVADNKTSDGRAKNRRVEINIAGTGVEK